MTNPIDNPRDYDTIYLCGEPSPGKCLPLDGAGNPKAWDKKKPSGCSGAALTFEGDEVSKFSVALYFWEREHFEEWKTWKRLLVSPTEKHPNALEIVHPSLAELPTPVTAVVVEDVSTLNPDGKGGWIVKIVFSQYRKPKPALATPKGSDTKPPGGETPKSRGQEMISQLTNQLGKMM